MRFSSRFRTAVHTLLIIHEYSKEKKVTSEIIAEIVGTSPVVIRNLLGQLKKAGFISVAPNKGTSGTTIAKPLEEITLLDVFSVVETDYKKEVEEIHNRTANRSYTGQYLNEIMTGYVLNVFDLIERELAKKNLREILDTLVEKEAASLYENPRALLDKKNIKPDCDKEPESK